MDFFSQEAQLAEIVASLLENKNLTRVIISGSESEAQKIESIVRQLASKQFGVNEILYIPGFFQAGVFRYESARKIIAKRIAASFTLHKYFPRIIICSLSGYLRNFPFPHWTYEQKLDIKIGDELDPDLLISELNQRAYMEVQRVEEVGEYAIRGSILDFWTPGEKNPSRIEFFGDQVDKIRSFRTDDQKSFLTMNSVILLPSREFVWPYPSQVEGALEKFNHAILSQKVMGSGRTNLLEDLKSQIPFVGIDDTFYMFSNNIPLSFHEQIKKIALKNGNIIKVSLIENLSTIRDSVKEILELYSNSFDAAVGKNHIVGKIDSIFPNYNDALKDFIDENKIISRYFIPAEIMAEIESLQKSKFSQRLLKLTQIRASENPIFKKILYLTTSKDSFFEFSGMAAKYIPEFSQIGENQEIEDFYALNLIDSNLQHCILSENIYCSKLNLEGGFFLPDSKTLAISESWLRGSAHADVLESFQDSLSESLKSSSTEAFLQAQYADFVDGDLVVHINHGVAIFRGLLTITVQGITGDFLALEYAGNDKIYVPVHKLNLIQRYIGSHNVTLDSLKSSSFEKKKQKTKEDIDKLAKELIEQQAKRAMTPGHAFAKIDEDYIAFEDAFPFDETPDQLTALKQIMQDMSRPKAMDRLLCGDVGFGKTEVAMRAAYRCLLDGKQVAWLVPTTVLAHQHYRSLKERCSSFGVQLEVLDRSVNSTHKVLQSLKKGEIDILIGTHRILSRDIEFRDLGLLIVDEEQRFGVLQKEKIKTMSYGVDVLTLSATPIPRTLQMAMVGLRDLSLLTTPPKSRLATKTFVCPFDENIIKEAIVFELNRGGQVFFVHNRVEELESVFKYLIELIPQARICIGHGKMAQKELEKTIISFLDGKFNVLLCTTIIESGIDMPNVNTIVIQNADHFGLSQLYQLRGRVGRRSTRGYAYFLTSPDVKEDDEGMRRLEILKEHQGLGSGFIIASHDMEMRGSGNILGDEQSGKMNDVGLETYMQMLDDAIKTLGGVQVTPVTDVEIYIPIVAQIPENYIQNAKERLRTYRRFFGARLENALQNLIIECEDRFGTLPEEVQNLAELARIRRWLLMFHAVSLSVGEDSTEVRLNKSILQSDSHNEANEALVNRILDVCNRKTKGMRILPDGRLLLSLRKKNFLQDSHGSIAELKRVLSLLAGEVYEGNKS